MFGAIRVLGFAAHRPQRRAEHRPPARIEQLHRDRHASLLLARRADLARHAQHAVAQVVRQIAAGKHVLDLRHAGAVQKHLALKARLPPMILILDETRIRPARHHRNQLVWLIAHDQRREVKLRRRARVLAQPHRLPVDVHVQRTLAAAEVQHYPPVAPGLRHVKHAPVDPGRVLLRHARRRFGKRHDHIRVMRLAEALHRPVARHGDLRPAARGNLGPGCLLRFRLDLEFPLAVQRHEPRRAFALDRERLGRRRKGNQRRARRQFVQTRQLRHLPGLRAGEIEHGQNISIHRAPCIIGRTSQTCPTSLMIHFLTNSFLCACFSCARIGICCGHFFSHAPQLTQASAFLPFACHVPMPL